VGGKGIKRTKFVIYDYGMEYELLLGIVVDIKVENLQKQPKVL